MYYMISDMLRESTLNKCLKGDSPYVGVISTQDWIETRDKFDLGIDLDLDLINMHTTKAEVNFDSLTGTFSIPDRSDIEGEPHQFAFVLDEKRIIFIDNSGTLIILSETSCITRNGRLQVLSVSFMISLKKS